jgi:catalase
MAVFGTTGKSHPLAASGHALEFLKDQYRHCKPILIAGTAQSLLAAAGIPAELPSRKADPGLIVSPNIKGARELQVFVKAVARHRHFERETDPPRI